MDVAIVGLALSGVENHSVRALSAALRAAGFAPAHVPFNGFPDLAGARRTILEQRPRVVGLSLQTIESALATMVLVRQLRDGGFDGRIVIGGHFATLNAHDLLALEPGLDAVVRFRGEDALLAIARGVLDPDLLADSPALARSTPGLIFRALDGSIVDGAPAELPTPGLVGVAARTEALPMHLGFAAADLLASRGCESHCAYCCVAGADDLARSEQARSEHARSEEVRNMTTAAGASQPVYVRRPIAALADEIADLWRSHGARVVNFLDDNVLPKAPVDVARWARELRAELDARGVGRLAITLQLRADAVDEDAAAALAALGLARAYVGVDGYTASHLKVLGRHGHADAGPRAVATLRAHGVLTVVNALLVGPTIPFSSVRAEVEGIARVSGAAVHLLPLEVRAGTSLFRAAERRGLVEGGVLLWSYRFADAQTERFARALLSLPTRLAERSVPIALYDLAYHVGIATRLLPEGDFRASLATFDRISAEFGADQVALLRRLVALVDDRDEAALETAIANERMRLALFDRALVAACDRAVLDVAAEVSRITRSEAKPHMRSKLLGAVAFAMTLAACSKEQPEPPLDASIVDLGAVDLGADDLGADDAGARPDACFASDLRRIECDCSIPEYIVTFDADGRATEVTLGGDGGALEASARECALRYLALSCYPSFASSEQTFSSHCWLA